MGDKVICNEEFGKLLLESLGLTGQKVTAIDIKFKPHKVVEIIVERAMFNEEAQGFAYLMTAYNLVPKIKPAPSNGS